MEIFVNGKPVTTTAPTLQVLLAEMSLSDDRVAVERNQQMVPRRFWQQTQLKPGDRIEVVQFVGGGC